jgi:deazaflavin-dependent oxidoreductase (nitroreductase family)
MTRHIPRWLARAPIPLYRHGLGRLLGRRMAMLEHHGRKTGTARYAVLEVIRHGPHEVVLVSGYGPRSQWFRNIQANPAVRVWTAGQRAVPAHAEILSTCQSREELEQYRTRHRHSAVALGRLLNITDLTTGGPLPADTGVRLPLVRIQFPATTRQA